MGASPCEQENGSALLISGLAEGTDVGLAKKRQQRPITAPTVRHLVSRGEREVREHRECDRGERREPQEVTLGERVISPFGDKPPKRSTTRKGEREKEGDNGSVTNSGSQGPHDDVAGRKSAAGTRKHKNSREARCNTGDRATKERSNRRLRFAGGVCVCLFSQLYPSGIAARARPQAVASARVLGNEADSRARKTVRDQQERR